MSARESTPRDLATQIIVTVFRVNARLLEKGDQLVAPLGMTSARWQILGAFALADQAPTCPQIAALMGITRQGAQKQINLALDDGLIRSLPNPRHERSPLYALTEAGREAYAKAMALQAIWVTQLVKGMGRSDLQATLTVLSGLDERLQSTPVPTTGDHA